MQKRPSFIIGGAQKSGTTSLHYYLVQHKSIFMPIGERQETHFFDVEHNYDKGFEWYLARFTGHEQEQIMGQTSPLYLYVEQVPERIHQHLPDVKLIFILRHPVDRAYSHYWHVWKKNREKLSFREAIKHEEERIKKDFWHKRNFSYLSRGRYITQIQRFVHYFPMSQMLFIIFEDFKDEPNSTLKRCFEFLQVENNLEIDISENYHPTYIPKSRLLKKVFKNRVTLSLPFYDSIEKLHQRINLRKGYPKMDPKIRARLIEFFYDDNQELESLLNINLSHWYH